MPPAPTPRDRADRTVFFVFAAAVAAAFVWLVVRPLLAPLLLAALAVLIFRPVHHRVERLLGRSTLRSAAASTLLLTTLLGVPGVLLTRLFVVQLRDLATEMLAEGETRSRLAGLLDSTLGGAAKLLETAFGRGVVDPRDLALDALARLGGGLYERLPDLFALGGRLALGTLVAVLAVFYLFLRGRRLVDGLVDLVPMRPGHTRRILERLESTVQGVFLGTLATVAVQGLVGAAGFWLLGFQNAVLWGVLLAAAGLVPLVGTGLVWGPAAIYLATSAQPRAAVAMLVIGAVVSTVDNLLRPLLIHGRSDISPLLVFFGILGGLRTLGPMGLIYGPLLVAMAVETVAIYRELRPPSAGGGAAGG